MQEVEEVELLLIKARRHICNLYPAFAFELSILAIPAFYNHHQFSQLAVIPAASMAKSDSKKRAELMAKEWKKSWSSTRSLNHLVGMGLLHIQEIGGWRAPEGESYPDPRAGEIVVFEDFSKGALGFLSILSSRAFFFTMRSGSAICTRTQFFLSPPLFICARPMLG